MRYFRILRLTGIASAVAFTAAGCGDTLTPTAITPDDAAGAATTGGQINYQQVDRFGKPAVATVFISTSQKDAFNTAAPAGDVANYTAAVVGVLTAFGHPNPAGLAAALLPDVQPINTSQPTTFLNGRRLHDDVITAELGLIFGSNSALNDDHVDANDVPFRSQFPYLASPHVR